MKGSTRKYKLKDGAELYYYVFRTGRAADGKLHSVLRRGFKTKREAYDALANAIREHKKGTAVGPANDELFESAFNKWSKFASTEWEPSTVESNGRRAAYALALFGKFKLSELNTMQIDFGMDHLKLHGGQKTAEHPKGKPLSPKTCHAVYSLMRQFFKQLVAWKTIEAQHSPMLGTKVPSIANTSRADEALTPREYNKLLGRLKTTRYYPLAILGSDSGMRCGELLALQRTDIEFSTGDITVSKSLQQTKSHGLRVKKTKNSKTRIARISPETVAVLREHFKVIDRDRELLGSGYIDNGLVFPSPMGEYLKPKQVSGRMSQFMRECGIQKTLHRLRHFCASVRLSNGESPVAVAATLGHDPALLMKIYAHAMPGDRERGVEIWQKAMSKMVEQKPEPPQPQTAVITPKKPGNSENVITGVITRRLQIVSRSNKSA